MHQGVRRRGLALAMAASLIALAACRDVYVYPLRGGAGGAGGAGEQPPVTCPASALVGSATLGAGTTGGGAGPVMVVRTVEDLKKAGLTSGPLIIRISGMLTASDQIDIGSDKTVEGEGTLSGLTGAGLRVKEAHNVIFRNLVISKAAGTGDKDAIHLQTAVNVWIDHCDFSSDLNVTDTYDGLVDISHACDDITVSWTRFHDHGHACLIGHSVDNAIEDTGHLTVTFHGNLFDNVESELPRVRFGKVHVFNNYYRKVGLYAIASVMGADVVVERTVFEGVALPMQTHYEDPLDGRIRATDNRMDTASGGSNITAESPWIPPYPYAGALLPLEDVARVVDACAGVAKP